MDQMKIGRFIAERRKRVSLTQLQLAEKLGITDRAVSKWETGKAMPDASIMLELCGVLEISVNDLLCGEVVGMEDYSKKLENNLLDMSRQKEQADKRLLFLETVVGISATVIMFALVLFATFVQMASWLRVALLALGFALFFAGCFYALRIEQVAGYFACKECGHRYVPTYKAVNMAPQLFGIRYMKCPECGKKSWQKKVLSRE